MPFFSEFRAACLLKTKIMSPVLVDAIRGVEKQVGPRIGSWAD